MLTDPDVDASIITDGVALLARAHPASDRKRTPAGIVASIVPATRGLASVQAIAFPAPSVALDGLALIHETYARHGITAWTAQVPDDWRDLCAALATRGYREIDRLTAMRATLAEPDMSVPRLSVEIAPTLQPVAAVNGIAPALAASTARQQITAYALRDGGQMRAACITRRRADDVRLYWVATHPASRRQGYAAALLRGVHAAARRAGAATATLHATEAGQPLYLAAGYKPTGRIIRVYRKDA